MMSATEVLVIVTAARFPRVLATNRGKVINQIVSPLRNVKNALATRHESEGRGFESQCRQGFFSHEISVKVSL